ncbi:MAG: UbiA family prenyltransferase [Pseudomonadota bacterium]
MATVADERKLAFWRRLWIYQAERFPILKTGLLIAAFSAASINVSAFLAERTLPGTLTYVATWFLVLSIFFQMRAADEWKDLATDRQYRPERAIPRGLISLQMVIWLAVALVPVAALVAATLTTDLVWLLALVWLWLGLMTVEFFAPAWLKARPIIYLMSHMMIMPLIDLLATGAEWLKAGATPPDGLWLFLVLSFVNGCVIEVGRKLFALENERRGVDTYSALWGPARAVAVWSGLLIVSFLLLVALSWKLQTALAVALLAGAVLLACLVVAWRYAQSPTPRHQSLADAAAGAWVLISYAAVGFLPLLTGGI